MFIMALTEVHIKGQNWLYTPNKNLQICLIVEWRIREVSKVNVVN